MNFIFPLLIICMSVFLGGVSGFLIGYESGQVDALNGNQNYKMVTNSTTSVTWQKK